MTLNGMPFGGRKKEAMIRDHLWNLKYLPKFKWDHLNEKFEYDQKVRDQRLKLELSQAKKQNKFFVEKTEISKRIARREKAEQEESKDEKQDNQDPVNDKTNKKSKKKDKLQRKRLKEVERMASKQHKRVF